MAPPANNIICRLKAYRLAKGYSQTQLAELVGVKRQAIYDIESGKYAPNTTVALRLARELSCRVEDLFSEETDEEAPYFLVGDPPSHEKRVSLAVLRGRLLAFPLGGTTPFSSGFEAADGLIDPDRNCVQLLCPPRKVEGALVLQGCDPAFALLDAHVSRLSPDTRVHCRFASSLQSVRRLASGLAHIAGTHFFSDKGDANLRLVRECLGAQKATIFGFSRIEEGLLVAPGNPLGIRGVEDLANPAVRLVNREPGAALRTLLDDQLRKAGLPPESVTGYGDEVHSHSEGAQRVLYRQADAALGFRAVARLHGLDFVSLESAKCELVLPQDLLELQAVQILLDTLQTRKIREDIRALAGYEAEQTGSVIAEV